MKQLFLALAFEMPDAEAVIAAIWEIQLYGQRYGLKIPLILTYICASVLQC